jgi:hypothetical protein
MVERVEWIVEIEASFEKSLASESAFCPFRCVDLSRSPCVRESLLFAQT